MIQALPEILVAGELYVDLILTGLDTWPAPGKEVFADRFNRDIGGGGAITASALAQLGTRSAIFGVLGADSRDWFLSRLKESGVETGWMETDDADVTAFSVVASTAEDRGFLSYHGANRRLPQLLQRAAQHKRFQGVRHIHLSYAPDPGTAVELFHDLRSGGCTLSLDVGWIKSWLTNSEAWKALQHVDLFFPNHMEAILMTGEEDPARILESFASHGIRRVALKLGSRGAAVLWDGAQFTAPPIPVLTVDTTGAGDCFNAGFLHAWLRQSSPETCLQAGNICGALSTEGYGGVASVPNAERLEREMTSRRQHA